MAPFLDPAACGWDTARYFIFSANVFGDYIYYSHLFPTVAALVLGLLVWVQAKRNPINIALLAITVIFSCWTIIDLILWATEKTTFTMFFWSILIYFDLLLYVAALYFCYLFIDKKDVSLGTKLAMALPFIPLFFLTHTSYNLIGFDYSNCDREALEGPLWQYVYLVEVLIVAGIASIGVRRYGATADRSRRHEIVLVVTGVLLFLLAFSWGNIVGSLTIDWDLGQYGLFGMPVFLSFLVYLIVRYRGFGMRVLAAQALVVMVTLLILAILLVQNIEDVRTITIITALLTIALGYMLIRSVQQEVRQRELIEAQEKELQVINKQQEGLLAFISHEVKGYLAKSQAAFAGIVQGDYGVAPEPLKKMADVGLADMRKGVEMVADILDASNLRKGTVRYDKKPFDIRKSVEEIVHDLEPSAAAKGVKLDLSIANGNYILAGDEAKVRRHVIRNLIDNSIHYTPTGNIHVSLSASGTAVHFSVKDTGVGITKEDMAHLFTEGGHGKESLKINVDSTGYGLFIAKQVTEAHGGTISAWSKGKDQGSEFIVELPLTT